jgi:hypothetical protein
MNVIIIKQCGRPGADTQIFRAYGPAITAGQDDIPLGIGASTTGNPEFGALHCAAKAFKKYSTVAAPRELDNIETLIKLELISTSSSIWKGTPTWRATLTL